MKDFNKGFSRYDLDVRVIDALPKIGYKKPTPVQHKVIPLIIQRRNLIVEAATGTGKTAAYGLPLISRLDLLKRTTQALIFVPSRELALQVEQALRTFTTNDSFRIEAIYGGSNLVDSERKVKSSPHILIAVPGRLKDVLATGRFDHFWRDIKYLIIDEADKLLELGFQDTLDNLVSHVRNNVQVALFSATISADVEDLIRMRFRPIMTIRLSPQEALKNNRFYFTKVHSGQHARVLAGLIRERKVSQALIFCNKRSEVYELASFLRSAGFKTEAYHGLLDQVEREAIMKRFKSKALEFLVATDLAARGVDVERLPAVINYSVPKDPEVYLHRCGRTGRAGRRGAVYNLLSSKEEEIYVNKFHEEFLLRLDLLEVEAISRKELTLNDAPKLVKVHFNRGKKDKIRPADVVGFLLNNSDTKADHIGTISIYDSYTLVDIPEHSLAELGVAEDLLIKKKKVKVTPFGIEDQKRKAQAVKKKQLGVRDKKALAKRVEKRKKD